MDEEAVIAQVTKTGRLYMGLVLLTAPMLVAVAAIGQFQTSGLPSEAGYAILAAAAAAAPIGLTLVWTKMLTYQALQGGDRAPAGEERTTGTRPPKAKAFTERLALLNTVLEFPCLAAFIGLAMRLPVEACAATAAVGLLCAIWAFVELPEKARRVLIERQ